MSAILSGMASGFTTDSPLKPGHPALLKQVCLGYAQNGVAVRNRLKPGWWDNCIAMDADTIYCVLCWF
jgi:hypothetical protein